MWQILYNFWTSFLGSGPDESTLQLVTLVSVLSCVALVISIPIVCFKRLFR